MDKIKVINSELNKIRTSMGMECEPLEEVVNAVVEMAEDTSRSGLTTVFVFSSTGRSLPTATSINMRTGAVEDLDEEWTQDMETSSTYSLRGGDFGAVYMSKAVFDASGNIISKWSNPVNLRGASGLQGEPGESGKDGAKGEKGDKGDDGIVYRTVMAYTATDTTDAPTKPYGGYWNRDTNEVTEIGTSDGHYWYTNSDDVEKKKFRWISEASFTPDGNVNGEWSTPFRITGDDGQDGTDGTTIEFIYRLLPDMETYEALRLWLEENPLFSSTEDDRVPSKTDNLTETTWTDSPMGISEEWPLEVVSSRSKDLVTNKWKNWTNCFIWSKWGEDGTDGDGVEYIYLITPKTDGTSEINAEYVKSYYLPSNMDALLSHPRYQENEFCINSEWSANGFDFSDYNWTDEPSDVGPSEPVEWVLTRKKTAQNGERSGSWGVFSEPKIWATFSEDGDSFVTSFVFTRSNDNPDRPEGGDFMDPTPDNSDIWSDSVPSGTQRVWMSKRTFCSNADHSDPMWSYPSVMSDSPNFQVEYSADEKINLQFLDNLGNYSSAEDPEAAWRENQLQLNPPQTWGDDDTIVDPIWMATCNYTNGEWSNWVLTRIKGEKGDAGENGSSVAIEGQFDTVQELLDAWDTYVTKGSVEKFYFHSKDNIINQGDGWFVLEDGMLYSYSGGYVSGETDSEFSKYWFSTLIKGKPGDSVYFYTAYCDEDPTKNPHAILDLKNPKKYIGTVTSNTTIRDEELRKPGTYTTWTKWQGEDGWGQEQVFILTTAESGYTPDGNHPPLPTYNNQEPDYLPPIDDWEGIYSHNTWQDSPLTVSEEYPYCWVATRKTHGSEFREWTGFNEKAVLYSRYSYDGVSSVHVMLTDDLAVIPMEEGVIDPDFKDEVSTYIQVYSGEDPIPSNAYEVVSTSACVKTEGNKATLIKEKITSETKTIPLTVKLNESDYEVTWHILMTDTAYELEPSTNSIRRITNGDKAGMLDQDVLKVRVYKWDGSSWQPSTKPLFAEITSLTGTYPILTEEDGKIKRNDEVATIDLTQYKDVSKITVYVVQTENGKDYSNGTKLSYEVISIAADGLDGGKFDVNLYPDWTNIPMEGNVVDPDFIEDDDEELWTTTISVTKDGKSLSTAQTNISVPEKYRDLIEIEVDEYDYPTGKLIITKPKDFTDVVQSKVPIIVSYKYDDSVRKTVDWKFTKSENAFRIELDKTVLQKDDTNTYVEDSIHIDVLKSDGKDFVASTKKFFAEIVTKGNSGEIKYVYAYDWQTNSEEWNGSDETQPGITVDDDFTSGYDLKFDKIEGVKNIRFYLTSDNESDGFTIISETVPVYDKPVSVKSVEKKFLANNDPNEKPSESSSDWNDVMPELTDDRKYGWCKEITTYTNGTESKALIYICAVKGQQGVGGVTGNTGKPGPVIYAAGVWSPDKEYKIEQEEVEVIENGKTIKKMVDSRVPYVYLITYNNDTLPAEDRYWKLKVPSANKGVNPAHPGNKQWEKMPYFESIYADAGAFNQALVGAFVFHGEHMYSQLGKNKSDSPVSYTDANMKVVFETPTTDLQMYPNAWINAKTGNASFAAGAAKFNNDGTWKLGGSKSYLEMDTNGTVSLTGITLKWSDVENSSTIDKSISDAQTAAQNANDAAAEAKKDAESSQKTADNANTRMDGWVADEVISKLELQGIKDEKVYIEADKSDIDKQVTRYSLTSNGDYTNLGAYYDTYLSNLENIINGLTGTTETVSIPDNFATNQSNYYNTRTLVLDAISKAAKKVADTAKNNATAAQTLATTAKEKAESALTSAEAAALAAELANQTANNNKWTTEIGEDWLKTTSVVAQYLQVNAANITGTLEADVVKANKLIIGDTDISGGDNAIHRILVTSAVPSDYKPNTLYLVVS